MIIEIQLNNEAELRELQATGKMRVAELAKLQKKAEEMFVLNAAADVFARLALWLGRDGEPGISERIAEQMSVFDVRVKEGDSGPQMDAFRAAAEAHQRQSQAEARAEDDSDDLDDADYEIVDELPGAQPVRLLASGD